MKGQTTGFIKDCSFEDWGYDYTGVTSAGANAYALTFQGSVGVDITGNSFKMNEWALDEFRKVPRELLGDIVQWVH